MTSKKVFNINDPEQLNLRFYTGYDANYLFTKSCLLTKIVDDPGHQKALLSDDEDERSQELSRLSTEIYFTEFQQFESFFALMLASLQDLPHWLFLSTYKNYELKNKLKSYLAGEIDALTNGKFTGYSELFSYAIYSQNVWNDKYDKDYWDETNKNLKWIVDKLADKFIRYLGDYTSYKHGLRVIKGKTTLSWQASESESFSPIFSDQDSLQIIQTTKEIDDTISVEYSTRYYDRTQSFKHISVLRELICSIRSTRLYTLDPDIKGRYYVYHDFNKKEFNSSNCAVKRGSFTYPA